MQHAILILAAGSSTRMRGRDKLLEPIDGKPLLARIAGEALATGLPVTVVLPPDLPTRALALNALPVTMVEARHAAQGMSESLKAGLATIPRDSGVVLLLADLPEITAADIAAMQRRWSNEPMAILRGAGEDGVPGHPVCFPPDLRDELETVKGDEGARSVIIRHRARLALVPLPGRHATTDLDTPEDWAAWRAARGEKG